MERYLTTLFPHEILKEKSNEYISIYMPTHRTAPDNKQDVVRFKNLVSKLDNNPKFKNQVAKLKELENDLDFWRYNLDGLAILMTDSNMVIYRLPRVVKEYLSIEKRFQVKPLIRNYQSDHRYYALGLARDNFRLYSGNRYGFREVEIPDEMRLLDNVLGDQRESIRVNVASHGGAGGNHFGHSTKNEEIAIDTKKFFAYADDYVNKNYSGKNQIPLILVSLPEHQSIFRALSKNKYLLNEGLNKSYESMNVIELSKNLWDVLEPIYNKKTADLLEAYEVGINNNTATNTIQSTLNALVNNQVRTIVIESDRQIYGNINLDNISFELDENGEDILNHLALLALDLGSEVIILDKDKMPNTAGVFSILRY